MDTTPVNIHIVTGDVRPVFRQIVDGISLEVVKGTLAPGNKLPSVRALAQQLLINPNTVAKAYTELTNMGFLESRKGLGIFVKQRRQILSEAERYKRLDAAIEGFTHEVIPLDIPVSEMLSRLAKKLESVTRQDT
jgi:GntR family transcriptional regulator